jgi:hypothetical protein
MRADRVDEMVRREGIEPSTYNNRRRHEAIVAQRILKTDEHLRGLSTGTEGYGRGREGAKNGTSCPVFVGAA